jgi:hypothetical protein
MLHFFQGAFNDPSGSPPVAERISRLCHPGIRIFIIEQFTYRGHQSILVRADEPRRAP